MLRRSILVTFLVATLAAGAVGAAEPVFDDQGQHPQLLPKTSMEYEFLMKRKGLAAQPRPSADAEQISQSLANCEQIAPLSASTREKCEIRARQAAPVKTLP